MTPTSGFLRPGFKKVPRSLKGERGIWFEGSGFLVLGFRVFVLGLIVLVLEQMRFRVLFHF